MSFNLLSRLSSLGLIRGLPKLKFEKDLVCHPCRHGKMNATSHPPINQVMTAHPGELLHMDTVGPSRVMSVGGKWYVLVIVDDISRVLSCTGLLMSCDLDASPVLTISEFLVAGALC